MDIHEMELHQEQIYETGAFGETIIVRVPGGWIYSFTRYSSNEADGPISTSTTFVPYSVEFS
jgi:hypothetical protein